MLTCRIIPLLLLRGGALVKTVRFHNYTYVGDAINTARIFNELEVDELTFLDIDATRAARSPDFSLMADIADECFMPLSYGGGIRTIDDFKRTINIGFEKVVVNSYALERPKFISEAASLFGSQSVIASIDVRRTFWGKYEVFSASGTCNTKRNPVAWANELESLGAGEILLTSIDREGTWSGFDVELIHSVTSSVSVPVIAHGGAGTLGHIATAIKDGGASAIALGSLVVFQRKDMGVLVNFPDKDELKRHLA